MYAHLILAFLSSPLLLWSAPEDILKADATYANHSIRVEGTCAAPDGAILLIALARRVEGLYENSSDEQVELFRTKVMKQKYTFSFGLKPEWSGVHVWRVFVTLDPKEQPEAVRKAMGKNAAPARVFSDVRIASVRDISQKVHAQGKQLDLLIDSFQSLWKLVLENKKTVREASEQMDKASRDIAALQKDTYFKFTVRRFADIVQYTQVLSMLKEGEVRRGDEDGRIISVPTISYYLWELHQRYIHETLFLKMTLMEDHWQVLDELVTGEAMGYVEDRWARKIQQWQAEMDDIKALDSMMKESPYRKEDWEKHLEDKVKIGDQEVSLSYSKLTAQIQDYLKALTTALEKKVPLREAKEAGAMKAELSKHFSHYLTYLRMTRGKHH